MLKGIILVSFFSVLAFLISFIPAIASLHFSPLVIGIVIGIIYANSTKVSFQTQFKEGTVFSAKKILRGAIVLYGFHITFQSIYSVGLDGFIISLLIVISTFILGTVVGTKIFKLDRDTSMLTASGSSVCGAAAVLATEPVLKAEPYKSAVAVSTVVFFGTISMFLYPIIESSGILDLDPAQFGIYIGATIHEVAQVVAVGGLYGGVVADDAVIVKMTRVMLIAPMLLILGFTLAKFFTSSDVSEKNKIVIPWFAVGFIAMSGVNSLNIIPAIAVDYINQIDVFLLTMAMTALGMETNIAKFKDVGLRPIYTAGIMFIWLLVGGYFITKVVTEFI
ncbi:putative integral membrane protein [Thiovulum sp. ES]|nr:putative integral membrane protein [Thiovulum sp. ES]